MNEKLTTVFFGSGPVALRSLELLSDQFLIEAIVTKPATSDTMQHAFPAKPVYAISNRAELDQLIERQGFSSRFAILIDFGVIISQYVINAFPLGIINSHFSLLPEWRGADPITFAILSGQAQTGVSLMLVAKGMDEGPLLAQAQYDIPASSTTLDLTANLINISDQLIKTIVPKYVEGIIAAAPQERASILANATPTYSHKLSKDDGKLDWTKPAAQLEREIRAYISWPRSYTTFAGRDIVITQAKVAERTGEPGDIQTDHGQLFVCCGQQALEILQLKPAGKPAMSARAFLAGYGKHL